MSEENDTYRNPVKFLHENGMMPLSDYGSDLDHLRDVLLTILDESRPVAGHPDPRALRDCWTEVFETIDQLRGERDLEDGDLDEDGTRDPTEAG